MPIAPELLLLILGLPVAVIAATYAGGLVGRLIRTRLDERRQAPGPGPERTAAAGQVSPAPRPVPAPVPVPAPGPVPAPLIDPEGARRLAGLPPPVATRIPSAVSPAMAARGGIPLSAGAADPEPEPAGNLGPGRAIDRRIAAAPFGLSGPAARATGPAAIPAAARPAALPSDARRGRRRVGLLAGSLGGVGVAVILVVVGILGTRPAGEVLDATSLPSDGGSGEGGPTGSGLTRSLAPGETLGPVVPGGVTSGGGTEPGGGGTGTEPGGGGTGTGGTATSTPTIDPSATRRPGGTPRPLPTATPPPSATPGPTVPPTPDPTAPPTPAPTPAPTPPPPTPTPAPTTKVKPPVADFDVTVDGLTVELANRTRGATSWSWTFGDGTGSTARNPTHTYAAAGTYTIRLVVTGDGGTDSTSRTVTVGG